MQYRLPSPPMRGRGLKPVDLEIPVGEALSPPMRGRGLKLFLFERCRCLDRVAPHAGAWIETTTGNNPDPRGWSPPMRGRGLKLAPTEPRPVYVAVAPHAGAWIETKSKV